MKLDWKPDGKNYLAQSRQTITTYEILKQRSGDRHSGFHISWIPRAFNATGNIWVKLTPFWVGTDVHGTELEEAKQRCQELENMRAKELNEGGEG